MYFSNFFPNLTSRNHSNAKPLVGGNYKNGWFTILPTLPYASMFYSLLYWGLAHRG